MSHLAIQVSTQIVVLDILVVHVILIVKTNLVILHWALSEVIMVNIDNKMDKDPVVSSIYGMNHFEEIIEKEPIIASPINF